MLKSFNSLVEFQKEFNTELKCAKHLIQLRWSKTPYCPRCGSVNKIWKLASAELFKCGACNRQFSVRVGTIFEDSKLPLLKWFLAFYLEINHKKGISSYQLGKDLGVRQATAWFMQQRIRYALEYKTIEKMKGDVELDETYIGGIEKNKHDINRVAGSHGGKNKHTVFGLIQRGGNTILQYINKRSIKLIKPIIENYIDMSNSTLHTDDSTLYRGYDRSIANHSKGEYANNNAYTNTVEGVFSHFKRYLNGTHHQVSTKYLQKYINVFTYKYNNRLQSSENTFNEALCSMFGKRLDYKELIT